MNTHSTLNPQLSTITKQPYIQIPFAKGLQWRGGGDYLYEEKKDGVWTSKAIGGSVLIGEQLRNGQFSILNSQFSIPGFFAFDLAIHEGQDIRKLPLRQRLERLDDLTRRVGLLRPARGTGGEFLETIVTRGGEGVVAKHWDGDWWQPLYKSKRAEVFHCIVLAKDQWKQSVELGLLEHGGANLPVCHDQPSTLNPQPSTKCGRLPLGYDRFQQCRVGSVLKVEAYGLTAKRQLREARPDQDTATSWLIRY